MPLGEHVVPVPDKSLPCTRSGGIIHCFFSPHVKASGERNRTAHASICTRDDGVVSGRYGALAKPDERDRRVVGQSHVKSVHGRPHVVDAAAVPSLCSRTTIFIRGVILVLGALVRNCLRLIANRCDLVVMLSWVRWGTLLNGSMWTVSLCVRLEDLSVSSNQEPMHLKARSFSF